MGLPEPRQLTENATTIREFIAPGGDTWLVWRVSAQQHGRPTRLRGSSGDWLCFATADERRLLAPVPVQWDQADEAALQRLWSMAVAESSGGDGRSA